MKTLDQSLAQVELTTRNFYPDCYAFARRWVRGKKKFTSEDMIEAFEKNHNFKPNEKRVWGAVVRRLRDSGLIRRVGMSTYKGIQGHAKPCNVWSYVA